MNMIVDPQIVDPESIKTAEGLRLELHRVNEILVRQMMCISRIDRAGSQVAAAMENVLRAHIKNESGVVADRLEAYLENRPRLRERLEEQLESERNRKVH